jgi:hypothetical protein
MSYVKMGIKILGFQLLKTKTLKFKRFWIENVLKVNLVGKDFWFHDERPRIAVGPVRCILCSIVVPIWNKHVNEYCQTSDRV